MAEPARPRLTRLLLTRPLPASQALATEIADLWPGRFEPVLWPLLRIEHESVPLDLGCVQALLFTSANGVEAFALATERRDLPALCVGEGTATAARAHGLAAESADGDAGALARLAAAAWLPDAGDYLHVRGRDMAGDLAGALMAEGIAVREVVLYSARPADSVPGDVAALLTGGEIDAVALFSPRTARIFAAFAVEVAEAAAPWDLSRSVAVAISAAVAEPLAGLGFGAVRLARRSDREAMLAAIGALDPAGA